MVENKENKENNSFYIYSICGRKSGYNKAKEVLEEKYINGETVEIMELARELRVTYTTARNYLYKFLKEELKMEVNKVSYNYKRWTLKIE